MPKDTSVSKQSNGFNRIARDLDRAISISRLTECQRLLFDHARELSWGFSDPKDEPRPFRFNFSYLARISGYDRSHLSRHAARLASFKMLVCLEDGTQLINKRYPEWADEKGENRLSDVQIEWCLQVRRNSRGAESPLQETVAERPQGVWPGTHSPPVSWPQGVWPGTHSPPVRTTHPGIEKPARTELRESNRESGESVVDAGAPAREEPAYPDDDRYPLDIHTGKHPINEPWAKTFWSKLWHTYGSLKLCCGFYEHQCWYSPEVWEAALRRCFLKGSRPETSRFIETIAAGFEANGIPADVRPEAQATPAPKLARSQQIADEFDAYAEAKRKEAQHGNS